MNAPSIIEAATADGLVVDLAQSGSLKAIGAQETVNRWRPLLKQHKAEIINFLKAKPGGAVEAARPIFPSWCNIRCEHVYKLTIPEIGTMQWCCLERDETHWRRDRIDRMKECPMEVKS